MKTYVRLLIFFILLVPTGICAWVLFSSNDIDDKEEQNEALIKNIIELLPEQAELRFCPHLLSGHRITTVFKFSFRLPNIKTCDIQEAQNLFTPYLEKAIEAINLTPEIRPYLAHFPITPHELLFVISFVHQEGTQSEIIEKPYISIVRYAHGKIEFLSQTPKNKYNVPDLETLATIPVHGLFENIAAKISLNYPDKKEHPILPSLKFSDFSTVLKNRFDFGIKYAQKEGLIYIADQNSYLHNLSTYEERVKTTLEMTYCAQETGISLDKAKELVRRACKEHLRFYQKDEISIRQIKNIQKDVPQTIDGKARQENLLFTFDFWDKYINRMQPPYLAQIYVLGNRIFYFTANEQQQLILLDQEVLPNDWDEVTNKDEPVQQHKL